MTPDPVTPAFLAAADVEANTPITIGAATKAMYTAELCRRIVHNWDMERAADDVDVQIEAYGEPLSVAMARCVLVLDREVADLRDQVADLREAYDHDAMDAALAPMPGGGE